MLPSDVVTHMCEFLSIRDYYTWRLTHKHAKSVYVEPKLRFKYAKDMFKEKRLLLKWCADFSCVNQVCTCIDLAKQEKSAHHFRSRRFSLNMSFAYLNRNFGSTYTLLACL
jgi:hypothetical protein